jgi:Uma2 family endonuclease
MASSNPIYDQQRKILSYSEYKLQEFDFSYEIINGELLMVPSPTIDHQEVISKVVSKLHVLFHKEESIRIVFAPLDLIVKRNPLKTYQPDIMIFREEKNIINEDRVIEGPPDVIIEVLSPGSRHKDFVKKNEVYEKFGVTEYWIIDPEMKVISQFYQSSQEKYGIGKLVAGEIASVTFKNLSLNISDIL